MRGSPCREHHRTVWLLLARWQQDLIAFFFRSRQEWRLCRSRERVSGTPQPCLGWGGARKALWLWNTHCFPSVLGHCLHPASRGRPWAGAGVRLLHLLKAPLAHGPGCRGLVVGEHLDASLAVHEPVMTVGGGAQCPGHLGPHCSALVIISLLGTCDETIGAYSSVMDSAEAPWELAWCCEGARWGRVLALL